jgi:hypothetical protein
MDFIGFQFPKWKTHLGMLGHISQHFAGVCLNPMLHFPNLLFIYFLNIGHKPKVRGTKHVVLQD